MTSKFDRPPGQKITPPDREAELREDSGTFELPSLETRQQFPFIKIDPELSGQELAVPETFDLIFEDACDALQVSPDGLGTSLRLLLHFGVKDPQLRELFFRYADRFKRELHGYLFNHRALEGVKIVDYGANEGGLVAVLRSMGAVDSFGIDITRQRSDIVRQRQALTDGSLEGSDMVISSRLLRTIQPPQHREATDAFMSNLKPGGLLITVPAIGDRLDEHYSLDPAIGQFDYDPEDIREKTEPWSYSIIRKALN